jgi:fructose-1-phosphate kinase PfkB-like protein
LAHGWLLGLTWQDRLRYAASAGAVNALRQDVAMVGPLEVNALVNQVRVERVC